LTYAPRAVLGYFISDLQRAIGVIACLFSNDTSATVLARSRSRDLPPVNGITGGSFNVRHRPSTAPAQRAKPSHADRDNAPESGVSAEQRAAMKLMGALSEEGLGSDAAARASMMLVPTLAAAGLIGVKQQTLALWRCGRQQSLPYVKMGRRVYYRFADLQEFIESRTLRHAVQGG
jgi:hypothetical protein